jgi:putative two-component system response regulator
VEVVILDDERVSLTLLEHYLRKSAHTAVRFTRAAEALQWCATHDSNLIIVDYKMPDMDGIEFTRRLRVLPGNAAVPVLMVSASTDRLLEAHALRSGVNAFLRKPIDAVLFSSFLESALPQAGGISAADHNKDQATHSSPT